MNNPLQPLGAHNNSRSSVSREEETETGFELVAQHREADEAAQTLVQQKATQREESQPATAFVVVSSQTGVVEHVVSDIGIINVTPRSSTPSNHTLADLLPVLSEQIETQNTTNGIQVSPSGGPNNSVNGVSDVPLTCLQFGDSLALSHVLDDHRDTIQGGSAEQIAVSVGFELPDLRSHYGVELNITDLSLVEQAGAKTQTPANQQTSVNSRVDELTAAVNTEFAELKRRHIVLEKSVSENTRLLKKQNEKLIEIVQQLASSTAQYKEDLAAVRHLLREHSSCNTSISILLETLVQRLLN